MYILKIIVGIYSFTGEEVMFVHCIDASGNCYRGKTRSFADTVAHVAGIVDRYRGRDASRFLGNSISKLSFLFSWLNIVCVVNE